MTMNTKNTRDGFDATMEWTMIGCVVALLLVAFVAAPVVYVWAVGILACVVILGITVTAAGWMASDGDMLDSYFAVQIAIGGLRLIGCILMALAGVNMPSSD